MRNALIEPLEARIAPAALSITGAAVPETDEGTTTLAFTIRLDVAATEPVTVDFSTADVTAVSSGTTADYMAITAQRVTFEPGELEQTVAVTILGDTRIEQNETFTGRLTNATGATIATEAATGTILADDGPRIDISDATVVEGNDPNVPQDAVFTVTLSQASQDEVRVNYATSDNTAATGDNDFVLTSGTLVFAAGETSKTITVPVKGDTKNEADESFFLNLSAPVNAFFTDGQGVGTITNDDAAPRVFISDVAIFEGDSGTGLFQFKVSLDEVSGQLVEVNLATADATATTADNDYVAKLDGKVMIKPGDKEAIFTVTVNGDLVNEADERFLVNVVSATNATIEDNQAVGTIRNNDVKLTVGDVTALEGDSGATLMDFTVTLSGESSHEVSVDFDVLDGTATQLDQDYVAMPKGTLVFAPGETTKRITVTVNGDLKGEANETFTVNLSNEVNAQIADAQATGTIINDDPVLNVSDASVIESGPGGRSFAQFTVTLDRARDFPVTVNYNTADASGTGAAAAGSDYEATFGALTFAAGETTKTILVPVLGDNQPEGTETFLLRLSGSSNATVLDAEGVGTIFDDESNLLSISDAVVTEGDTGRVSAVFVVSLGRPATQTVTVQYATIAGSATEGTDFVAKSGTVTINAGQSAATVSIDVLGDLLAENDETFLVRLSNATGAAIVDADGQGTIIDTDPVISIGIDDARVVEGDSDTTNAIFKVRLSSVATEPVTVKVSTVDGTATSTGPAADFNPLTDFLVTFAPGEQEKDVSVAIRGDVADELDESFSVRLSDATGGHIAPVSTATATIVNDEIKISIGDVFVTEGNTGTMVVSFLVSLNRVPTHPVTVDFATVAGGTATLSGTFADYLAKSESITFAPEEKTMTKLVTVSVTGDLRAEADETVFADLANARNAIIVDGRGVLTIVNDDAPPTLSIGDAQVTEGNASTGENDPGTKTVTFPVTLSAPAEKEITFKVRTANGTAVAGEDFTEQTGQTLIIPAGQTTQSFSVTVTGDDVDEVDETFSVELSDAMFTDESGAVGIGDGTGIGTILNDDLSISIADASLVEGAPGTSGQMTFTLSLSAASAHPVTVQFSTADNSAVSSGSFRDYEARTQSVTFAPGETVKTVSVTILGDARNETDEVFFANLSGVENAIIADGQARGTILNDEAKVSIQAVGATSVVEDNGTVGTVVKFKIVRAGGNVNQPVSVQFSTQDGTATATGRIDYEAVTRQTVVIGGGETESNTFSIRLLKDDRHENDETFKVVLSNPSGASVGIGELQYTIQDNDAAPFLVIDDAPAVTEGDLETNGNPATKTATFTVRLSAENETGPITADFATSDGTATSTGPRPDYLSKSGSGATGLIFAPGEKTKTISVTTNGDVIDEAVNRETFNLNLTNVQGATLAGSDLQAVGTIVDDDVATLSFQDLTNGGRTVTEGTGGDTTATLMVRLSHQSETPVTVDIQTIAGTASLTSDLVSPNANPSTVTFAAVSGTTPGETTKSYTYTIAGDSLDEPNETFISRLANAQGAAVTTGEATITIADDDATPVFAINSVSLAEGDSGTKEFVFQVSLTGPTAQVVTADFRTVDGTAKSTGPLVDFVAQNGTVTFQPGVTQQEIRVVVNGDSFRELDESFTVTLSNAQNGTIVGATGTGIILQDGDTTYGITIGNAQSREGNPGENQVINFPVELTAPAPDGGFTFNAATRDGSARGGEDFSTVLRQSPQPLPPLPPLPAGSFRIPAGESTLNVPVELIEDLDFEGGATEGFFVELSNLPAGAEFLVATARGSIYSDDMLQVDSRTVQYIDVDGDIATVRVSKGTLKLSALIFGGLTRASDFTFGPVNSIGGRSLLVINFADDGQEFSGVNLSVSAEPRPGLGGDPAGEQTDGVANVGFLRAGVVQSAALQIAAGIDLGKVTIDGDLGKVVAGDVFLPGAIRRLDVGSFGKARLDLPNGLDSLDETTSAVLGAIKTLIVRGDFQGNLNVIGDEFGDIRKLRIDGALDGRAGTSGQSLAQLYFTGTLKKGVIGNIIGGSASGSGTINGDSTTGARIVSLKILGDLTGGTGTSSAPGDNSGQVIASRIDKIVVGSIHGGTGLASGLIRAVDVVKQVIVRGDVVGGGTGFSTPGPNESAVGGAILGAKIGSVKIGGDLIGSAAANGGAIFSESSIGSVSIGGNVVGGEGQGTGSVRAEGTIRRVKIGTAGVAESGDVSGGAGVQSGRVLGENLKTVQVFGSILGGTGDRSGGVIADVRLTKVRIGENVVGGDAQLNKTLVTSGFVFAESIGDLVLGGSLVAGKNLGGSLASSGAIRAAKTIESLAIRGGIDGDVTNAAVISGGAKGGIAFRKIVIGGDVDHAEILAGYDLNNNVQAPRGTPSSPDARIGSIKIGGDVEALNIVAGVAAGADNRFGTPDDLLIRGTGTTDTPSLISRIASVIIRGAIVPNSDPYGIVAQHVVSVKVGAPAVPLAGLQGAFAGPGNNLLSTAPEFDRSVEIAPGTNFRAAEVPVVTA